MVSKYFPFNYYFLLTHLSLEPHINYINYACYRIWFQLKKETIIWVYRRILDCKVYQISVSGFVRAERRGWERLDGSVWMGAFLRGREQRGASGTLQRRGARCETRMRVEVFLRARPRHPEWNQPDLDHDREEQRARIRICSSDFLQ